MVIDFITIELTRKGSQTKLVVQGRPYGLELKITQEQLDQLIAEFTHFSAQWRETIARDFYRVLGVERTASACRYPPGTAMTGRGISARPSRSRP